MRLVLDITNRIVAMSTTARPAKNGIRVNDELFLMGSDYRVEEVAVVPAYVSAGGFFYINKQFTADPDRVNPTKLLEVDNKVKELDIQINNKPISEMTLDEYKEHKREENNLLLAKYLKEHPIIWRDGLYYGITKDDQDELTGNLASFSIAVQSGIAGELKWHSVGSECKVWDPQELIELSLAIKATVVPIVAVCQRYKVMILGAESKEDLAALVLDYSDAYMKKAIIEMTDGGDAFDE